MPCDEVVDILCTGSGAGGLAAAISAVDAGLTVFVADHSSRHVPRAGPGAPQSESWTFALQERWGIEALNLQTASYLNALTCDLGPPSRSAQRADLPVTVVEAISDTEVDAVRGGAVRPFFGSELKRWARDCLASPHSILSSRVCPSEMTEMRLRAGGTINAAVVVSLPVPELAGMALSDWLLRQAQDRGIEVKTASSLERLLFVEGRVVGAVIATPTGPRRIRARRGVVLGTGNPRTEAALPTDPMPRRGDMRLCVVSRSASRFARLELVTDEAMSLSLPTGNSRAPRLNAAARNGHARAAGSASRQS